MQLETSDGRNGMFGIHTRLILAFVATSRLAHGQATKFTFEVASIKPVELRPTGNGLFSTGYPAAITGDPSQIQLTQVSLSGLLARAYDLNINDVIAPKWLRQDLYDIAAKAPEDAPKGHILEMLQNLLTDRFGVKLHWETKETPGFALVVGKNGPKLHASPLTDTGVPQK